MTVEQALTIVYDALKGVNELRSAQNAVALEPNTLLAGAGGQLDSLEVVTLVLGVERGVEDATGQTIGILDADRFEESFAELRTPHTLATLVAARTVE